ARRAHRTRRTCGHTEVGMETPGGWQTGPVGHPGGMGSPDEVPGGWPSTAMWVYPGMGARRRGSIARFLAWSALAGTAAVAGLIVLAALLIPHTILLILLALIALPIVLIVLAVG